MLPDELLRYSEIRLEAGGITVVKPNIAKAVQIYKDPKRRQKAGKVSWIALVDYINTDIKKVYSSNELHNYIGKEIVSYKRLNFKLNELSNAGKIARIYVDKNKYFFSILNVNPPEE